MDERLRARLANHIIRPDAPLMAALQQMDRKDGKLLLVMEGDRYVSLLSIGDIQRALIRQVPLDAPVSSVLRPQVRVARTDEPPAVVRQRMLEFRTELMPVLDRDGMLADVIFWADAFPSGLAETRSELRDVSVVVMAGGLGTRLRPLTNVIPKALVPLGDQPIIEEIMDRFHGYGAGEFHVSLNYKADMVERYLNERAKPYRVHYYREDHPLGTAGSLHLVRAHLRETVFVSNCDILVDCDYADLLRTHREERNDVTAVAAVNVQSLPYGVFECDATGRLLQLREKPDVSLLVNVGLYVLNARTLDHLAPQQPASIPELIENVRRAGGRVGLFPIREEAWADIGEWPKYYEAVSARRRNPAWKNQ